MTTGNPMSRFFTEDPEFHRLLAEYRQAMTLRWIDKSQDIAAHNLARYVSQRLAKDDPLAGRPGVITLTRTGAELERQGFREIVDAMKEKGYVYESSTCVDDSPVHPMHSQYALTFKKEGANEP